jgi:hypothetical protein
MPILFRCPGELRHVTRGFLYDQRDHADADADKAKAEGWFDTLEQAAGLVPMDAAAPAKSPDGNSESVGDTKPQEAAAPFANVEGETAEELQQFLRKKALQVGLGAPTRADMIAALEAAGVDVDGRWGDKRLAAEFAKLKG